LHEQVEAQLAGLIKQPHARFPQVAKLLTDDAPDMTVFVAFVQVA